MKTSLLVHSLRCLGLLSALLLAVPVHAQTSPSSANKPLSAPVQILRNGSFEDVTKYWELEQISPAKGDLSVTEEGPNGTRCARVELLTPADEHWKMSLLQKNLKVSATKRYRVSFWAKASERRWVSVGFKQHLAPYKGLAHENDVEIGTEWSQVTLLLRPSADETNARFSIGNIGQIPGTFWLTNFLIIEE